MRRWTATYGALAAAVTLACGVTNAQQREELSEAEKAEIERQTEELRQRTEQIEQQTEELDEQTDRLAEQNDEREEREQEAAERRAEAAEERSEAIADEQELEQRRTEILQMAEESIAELREQDASAAELLEEAHGYAVFDTTKGGLIVTGAGGTGVAMEKDGSNPIFMHLGQAGIGLGAGLQNYRLVMLFEDQETYDSFVTGEWDGNVSAQAAAGDEGVSAEEQFIEGVRAYRLTDRGLMAQADVSGVRFWPSEDLNEVQVAEADDVDVGSDSDRDAADRAREAIDEAEDEVDEAVR